MYPQEEFAKVVSDIRETVVRIGINAKKGDDLVCKELVFISLDLKKAAVLIEHAKEMKRMPSIREEAKMFLSLAGTIEHWARSKSWDDLCGSLDVVSQDILDKTEKIQEMLKVKAKKERVKKVKKEEKVLDPVEKEDMEREEWLKEKKDIRDEMDRLRDNFAKSHAEREEQIPGSTQNPGKSVGLQAIFRNMFK